MLKVGKYVSKGEGMVVAGCDGKELKEGHVGKNCDGQGV